MSDETKATFTVDLTPVVQLVESVRDEVRGVRADVGTLSQKVAEVSVDHAQRITRTEDRIDAVEHRVTTTESKHDALDKRVMVLETAEAKDGAVQQVKVGRVADYRWRIATGLGGITAGAGLGVLIFYAVHGG